MGKYLITTGDFLKNAGIVGLYYILKEYKFDVIEGREYGIKEQGGKEYDFEAYESGLWLDEDFIENADWTDMFFKACVFCYRDCTVYARVEPYQGELEFLTNMGLAKRQNLGNAIAQSEIHRAYYTYTLSIDLDRVGEDGDISISSEQKKERVDALLDVVQYLYRDIKGRRENLSPLFVIGGNYARKNPFFENCVRIKNNSINTGAFLDVLQGDDSIKDNTVVGVVSDIFDNDAELKEKMHAVTVAKAFSQLKEKVSEYYDESN